MLIPVLLAAKVSCYTHKSTHVTMNLICVAIIGADEVTPSVTMATAVSSSESPKVTTSDSTGKVVCKATENLLPLSL